MNSECFYQLREALSCSQGALGAVTQAICWEAAAVQTAAGIGDGSDAASVTVTSVITSTTIPERHCPGISLTVSVRDDACGTPVQVVMLRFLPRGRSGFSLIELLCVMAIIAILASLMLPALAKGLRKARGLGGHLGSASGIEMRIDEVISHYTRYRMAHPNHGTLTRREFITELQLSARAETWLNLSSVEYRPFAATDPVQQLAIIVYPSPGGGSGEKQISFRIVDLFSP